MANKIVSDLIIKELSGSRIRGSSDEKYSIYDLIRVAGGQKNPRQAWKRLCEQHPDCVTRCDAVKLGDGKSAKVTPVATVENCLYILGLLPGVCGQAYREKAASLVRRYMEGDSDLGLEIMLRDHNRERFNRAKHRLEVVATNKQTATLAHKHGSPVPQVHNDRYRGLYRRTASQLREDVEQIGIDLRKDETPLNAMSAYDLSLNNLANMMALQCEDPNAVFSVADGLRELHERKVGKTLQPKWEDKRMSPSSARDALKGQMELPIT